MKYPIRVWEEQTLFDCADYMIEAGSPEEAAIIAKELTLAARDADSPVPDIRVTTLDPGGFDDVVPLDPHEVVDSFLGVTLLDANRARLRDLLPKRAFSLDDSSMIAAKFKNAAEIVTVMADALRAAYRQLRSPDSPTMVGEALRKVDSALRVAGEPT